MTLRIKPGLGELLRFVGELVDQGAEAQYRALNLNYRARYTPVLRAVRAGAESVTDITARTRLTQGAISQTIGLMVADGIVARHGLEDGRKSGVHLTARGEELLETLEPLWLCIFKAIDQLEKEIGHPLLRVLEDAALALERQDFAARLRAAGVKRHTEEPVDGD
ncbi:MarR family transcriptional regulator [Mesorhizobium sp. M2D.F.Ca.ET.185.01.1.1]|uniref:MarR family transcriptional regulator n=1 Tax=unclassified Mesorhizobium TaxID=325217 RepID=UPI000FCBADFE|nr:MULTISPECIES: helix-turn-helix domain-containing protein [unclassified Mesorhizobium]TGP77482.1 MarR family transcriptional regulator [bacterium M00.F.Ca.ET.227.01.1.1]TGP93277.1 MarR family transcriptional regulator [bacterium M00.F.Ca.ET.222.01.1.1]TGP96823.1 MarR family transcriptional regulator [bacterium M00.F.Ca.ET.221.01.1.1]TGT94984.1 MarR family transcriptional regulator [bacterium M00.F.Ca.ET.163.01.1.1]TGU21240.1 MarR family transcriptional regulator [bacterium M00.F.Ca.ET.156.01